MWRNTDTTVFRGDIVLRKAYTRYPFGGLAPERARLEKHIFYLIVFLSASRNDMLERNEFIRVFPQRCFDYACGSAETYPYIFALYSSATPRSGISSVTDRFHIAQQDIICRKANFIARTLYNFMYHSKCSCPYAFTTNKVPLTMRGGRSG